MKEKMTSVDIAAILSELNKMRDAKVEKSYQLTKNELLFKFYHYDQGKKNLIVEAGKRIHFTNYPRPAPERPPDFPMILRKYTKNANLKEFNQHNLDRVIEWEIEREQKYRIICELFGNGNVILCNQENEIIACLRREEFKDRIIKKGEKYQYPPSNINPREITKEKFKKILEESESDLVRTIATQMSLGGLYAEEICSRAEVDKNKSISELNQKEIDKVFSSIKNIFSKLNEGDITPQIVYEDNEMVDVLPISLKKYEGNRKEEYDSFNQALDEFFSKREINEVEDKKNKKYLDRLNSLKGRKEGQLQTAEQYEKDYEDGIKKGDLIYKYFKKLDELLSTIEKARSNYSWKEIKEKLKEAKNQEIGASNLISSIEEDKAKVTAQLDDEEVEIDIRKSLTENATQKYEEAKKKKRKAKGARKAAKETQKIIEKVESKGKESFEVRGSPQKKIRNKEHWYDEYRWFKSSDDFLVIGGRNATQNEEIVKKHMQKGDLFLHSQIEGGSATIIKAEGEQIPKKTKKEAAKFAACNSEAWKNYYSADVYQVKPDQVTKTPESGEYIEKGSFVIRGDRKYYRSIQLEYAVGIEIDELTRVIGGPPSAVEEHAEYYKKIIPGDQNRGKISQKITAYIKSEAKPEEEKIVDKLVTPDEIERFFPSGKLRLKNED
ncbi:fibronectin-binding domain-containing protein [archaeon SCG-AAA382B04]|nr:fibronectin-binding domain-containing protein [archaeon SCG-AAA382B04]